MSAVSEPSRARSGYIQARTADSAQNGHLALPVKLFLIALALPVAFNLGSLYLTGLRVLLLTMLPVLSIMLLMGRFGRIHIADVAFMLHLVWIFVALSVNNPDQVIQNAGSTGAEFLGGYMITRCFIRDRAQFMSLCKWICYMALLMLPLALYEARTGHPIVIGFLRSLPGLTSEGIVTIEGRLGMERVQAVFAHPIHFGLFCSTAFSLMFVALKNNYGHMQRIALAAIIALTGFFSLSSGAILAIALQFSLIIWFVMFRRINARWWILVGLFVLAYVVIDLLSTRTPIRVFMSYATFSAHNAYWRGIIFDWGVMNIFGNSINDIPPAPIFGIGLNDWIRPPFMYSGSMDNFWLVMGVRYGMPGLIFLVIGYVGTLVGVGRRDFSSDEELLNLRRGWMFIFVGLTFTLATVHVWTSIYSYVFFLFGAGIWMLTAQPNGGSDGAEEDQTPAQDDTHTANPYSRFPPHTTTRAVP